MKCCSNARVNQIVNKCLNGQFPHLLDDEGNHRQECFQNYDIVD